MNAFVRESLRLYNTLSRRTEEFRPIGSDEVKMYSCGPTLHDHVHISDFRTYVWQDLLVRWLEYKGYRVNQVMNLTDVDDKTIRSSRKEAKPLGELTKIYGEAFFEDAKTLNIKPARTYPKATEHLGEIVSLVENLMNEGYAYRGNDGSVYFDISKFGDYGKLSGARIGKSKSGTRISTDQYGKDEAGDFAIWKAWDENDGDVFWDTRIGKGRPGWHIEDVAMSMKYLGKSVDIHTGRRGLVFPHHENIIALAETHTSKKYANYWLHGGHLMVDGKDISKTHFYTLRDLTKMGYSPDGIRLFLLSTHYRRPFNFSFGELDSAEKKVERLSALMERLPQIKGGVYNQRVGELTEETRKRFEKFMDNDLRVNEGLGAVSRLIRNLNGLTPETVGERNAGEIAAMITDLNKVIGLKIGKGGEPALTDEESMLIKRREEARNKKEWEVADGIRRKLASLGVNLKDTPDGVVWDKARIEHPPTQKY